MIPSHLALVPENPARRAAMLAIADVENKRTRDCSLPEYPYAHAFFRYLRGRKCSRRWYSSEPSASAVRMDWIVRNIPSSAAEKYDVDGIQFNDYFYYESADSPLDDDATWQKYGLGVTTKGDWRRDNTYSLVNACHRRIKAIKPDVRAGSR